MELGQPLERIRQFDRRYRLLSVYSGPLLVWVQVFDESGAPGGTWQQCILRSTLQMPFPTGRITTLTQLRFVFRGDEQGQLRRAGILAAW